MRLLVGLIATALCLTLAAPALATNSPVITLTEPATTVLVGSQNTITLTAANPAGQPWGYNLSFQAVLPASVTYVSTATSGAPTPTVLTNEPTSGKTTLIWSNVGDLSPNSSDALTFKVTPSSTVYPPGSAPYPVTSGAYVNTDPRYVPLFSATGVATSQFTGSATASATTTVSAITLTSSEPSPEGKLLRGVHNHRTVYTLLVANNGANQTTGVTVDEYLPADLEWMGCGTGDHTTNAPTNPGSTLEYPGATALNASGAPTLSNCPTPATVQTVSTTPPGQPAGVYTHLTFNVGTLAANGTYTIQFVAGVPIRQNTTTWNNTNGVNPGGVLQGSNLDNNSGTETYQGEPVVTSGTAAGLYNGVTPVSSSNTLTRTAMDIRVLKSNNNPGIVQGQDTTWTLELDTSEYRYMTTPVVTDTIPDGLCPTNYPTSPSPDADCAGVAGDQPSLAWTSAVENNDGTWTVVWPVPRTLNANDTYTITYHTDTRTHYRQNQANTTTVSSDDSWANAVSVTANAHRICINGDTECTSSSTRIDGDMADNTPNTDTDTSTQTAAVPTISKTIQNTTALVVNCTTGTYTSTSPGSFHVGDKICYRLQEFFPSGLDTQDTTVTDFLPPNMTLVGGSPALMSDNTVTASSPTISGNTVTWTLGASNDAAPAQLFDAVIAGTITASSTIADGYIDGNLMKTSAQNTAGTTFPLRAEQDTTLSEPTIDLFKGVDQVNGGAVKPPNTDAVTVPGGAAVTWRVDVENKGTQAASNAEIWDRLAGGVRCATVSAISSGGSCVTDNTNGDYIDWTALSLPASSTIAGANQTTLTYTTTLPTTLTAGQTIAGTAGLRDYSTTDNQSGTDTFYPLSNIDPSVTAGQENAVAASDPSSVKINGLTFTHAATTSVNEAGNTLATQATIGEDITYTDVLTVPNNTTLYDNPGYATTLPATLSTTTASTLVYAVGGTTTALPSGWTGSASGSSTEAVSYSGASWTNTTGSSVTFTLTYTANVLQSSTNAAGNTIATTSTLSYQDQTAANKTATATVNIGVVEPSVHAAVANNAPSGYVVPGTTYTYTGTFSNSGGLADAYAHDNSFIVTVPVGVTPYTLASGGTAVADGGSDNGYIWNAGARTLTLTPADMAAAGSSATAFYLNVDSPDTSGASFQVGVESRTTSYPGTPPNGTERTWATTPHSGYDATASDTVTVAAPALTKSVSPSTATFGSTVVYTMTVALAANITYNDLTVLDTVPAGVAYDGGASVSCTTGCTGPSDTPSLTTNMSGSTVAFYLGVASASPSTSIPQSTSARTLTITYNGHVNGSAADGTTQTTNSANVYDDATSKFASWPGSPPAAGSFDQAGTAQTAAVTVVEPAVSIAKTVTGTDATGYVSPGDAPVYTLTVRNTSANWPLYNVHVTDQPSSAYGSITTVSGVSTTDNTTPWTAQGSAMAWDIPTIAAGASVTLSYDATLVGSGSLTQAEAVDNSASVSSSYGVNAAGRAANPGYTYLNYTAGPSTVDLTTDMPSVGVAQAANGTTHAQVGTAFTWKVTLTNNSVGATADTVNLADVLPPDWNYDTGTAQLAGVGVGDPTQSGQTLTWANLIATLAAGQSKVLTFQATPTTNAALNEGVGSTHPFTVSATDTWKDATGATADASGTYASGPATAQATLDDPIADMGVVKSLASGQMTEGQNVTYSIVATNHGPNVALNVHVADTLPSGLHYLSASSTVGTPAYAGGVLTLDLASLANGASATITLVAQVQPATAGSVANTATVTTSSTDSVPADNSSTVTTALARPTLTLTKTVAGNSLAGSGTQPGDSLTYTLAVANTGAATAYNVAVTDLPPNTIVSVLDTTGSGDATQIWTSGSHSLGWTIPSIASGATVDLSYTASPSSALHEGQSITNTAHVTDYYAASSATRAANPSFTYTDFQDVTASTATLTEHVPTVTLTDNTGVVGYPNTAGAQIGQSFSWHLALTNPSTAKADDIVVVDTLPADHTYVAGSSKIGGTALGDPTISGQVLTWSVTTLTSGTHGALVAGASDTLDFSSLPAAHARLDAQPQTNEAHATWEDNAGGTASADGTYLSADSAAHADLTYPVLVVTKTAATPTVVAGTATSYTITVQNTGLSTAHHVNVADTLPTGESYTAGSATAVPTTGFSETSAAVPNVVWQVATLNAGATVTLTVPVTVLASVTAGTVLSNSVAVTSDERPDPTVAAAPITATANADVSLLKTGPGTLDAGDQITWTLSAHDAGPSDAQATAITDPLPAGTTFVSADAPCTNTANTVTCALGTLADGTTQTVHITAALSSAATADVTNTASVASTTSDPDSTNNTSGQTTSPTNLTGLGITQTVDAPQVVQGSKSTFTLTVTNSGPSDAHTPEVVDTLPAGVTYVSATPGQGACSVAGQVITCELGDLADGAQTQIIVVTSDPNLGAQLNDATVAPAPAATPSADSKATVTVIAAPVVPPTTTSTPTSSTVDPALTPTADLRIVQSESALYPGGEVIYTLDVTNGGPDTGSQVVVTDPLPAGVSYRRFVSTVGSCTVSGQTVTCALGDMVTGASVSVQLIGILDPHAPANTTISNTAKAATSSVDPDLSNNVATVSGQVQSSAGPQISLRLSKVASVPVQTVRGAVAFTIALNNDGPDPATNAVVNDPVPAGLQITGIQASQGTCTQSGQALRCLLGTIAVHGQTRIVIQTLAPQLGTFTNVAVAVADGTQDDANTLIASAAVQVVTTLPTLSITKLANRATVTAGGTVNYAIKVQAGRLGVAGVTVCDQLPPNMDYVSAPGASFVGGHACWTIRNLKPGQSQRFTVTTRAEISARGLLRGSATATARSVRPVRAQVSVRARTDTHVAPNGVTG